MPGVWPAPRLSPLQDFSTQLLKAGSGDDYYKASRREERIHTWGLQVQIPLPSKFKPIGRTRKNVEKALRDKLRGGV